MSTFRKNLITVILIVLVYTWFFVVKVNHTPSPNVLGVSTNAVVFVQPTAGQAPIVDAINSAQKEILVEVYLLSDKQIINAL